MNRFAALIMLAMPFWFLFVNWITESLSRYLYHRELRKLDKKIREAIDRVKRLGPPEGAHGVFDPRPTGGRPVYARMVLAASKDDAKWDKVQDEIEDLVRDVEEGE